MDKIALSATLVDTVKMVAEHFASQARTVKQLVPPTKPMAALTAQPVNTRSLEARRLARNATQVSTHPKPNKSDAMAVCRAHFLATIVPRERPPPPALNVKRAHTRMRVERRVAKFASKDCTSQRRDKPAAKDAQWECFWPTKAHHQ
jgi:hypothetical protein